MWSQLNTNEDLVVFSVSSLRTFTAVNTRRSGGHRLSVLSAAAESAVAFVRSVGVQAGRLPVLHTRPSVQGYRDSSTGVRRPGRDFEHQPQTSTGVCYEDSFILPHVVSRQRNTEYTNAANGMRTRGNRYISSNSGRQLHVTPELFCTQRL
jgi:hypothetical protein